MKRSHAIAAATLVFLGFVLNFVFSGHNYIAYAMYFAAVLTIVLPAAGKTIRRVICALLAVGVIYFVAVEIPIIAASGGDNTDADAIIVLGAAVHGDTPSLSLMERINAAEDYLKSHPDCIAVLSGGQGSNENMSEARAMFDRLKAAGIAPKRLIMEDQATSTAENIKLSYEIIDEVRPDASVAVVSSEYHLYRAKLIAASQGHEVGCIPAHTTYPTVKVNYFIREAFGVTYFRLFG